MQTHQKRPVRDEIQELYDIAVKEHGADSRVGRIIRGALEQERQGAARATNAPHRVPAQGKGDERPR